MTTHASYSCAATGSISTMTLSASSMDVNHPYYLHPSDSPGLQLISLILSEHNYNQWSRSIKITLSSKLKLSFVDGTYLKLAGTSTLLAHWIRCNEMVTSWLLISVSIDIRNTVVYINYAIDTWRDLRVRYSQSNVPKLFQLSSEISHLSQGIMSIASYFSRFRVVHDELNCMSTRPRCTCTLYTCTVNANLIYTIKIYN